MKSFNNVTDASSEEKIPTFSILSMNEEFPKIDFTKKSEMNFALLNNIYRKQINESIEKGYFPFLPSSNENIIDTSLAVKLSSKGVEVMHDTTQIMLKIKQAEIGAATPEFVTDEAIKNAVKNGFDVSIKTGERGLPTLVSLKEKDPSDPNKDVVTGFKTITYYNVSQLNNPENIRAYFSQGFLMNRENRQAYLNKKYGDKAYHMGNMDYPSTPTLNADSKPFLCNVQNASSAIAQAITAGLKGRYMRMYPAEAAAVKKSIEDFLSDKSRKNSVFQMGKQVGNEVKAYLKAFSHEASKPNQSKEPAAELEM